MKSMKKAAAWIWGVLFLLARPVFADNITLQNPIGTSSFTTVANNVLYFIYADIAIPLCVIMVLVGGFQMMTSAGDPEKVSQGRKTLTYAAVGLVVVILAGSAVTLIQNLLGQ